MRLPEGWEKHSIGNICQSIVPGRNKPKFFDGDIPWVTTPEIQGRYVPSKFQKNYVSEFAIKESGAKVIPTGSVIISAVGELGLVAIAKEPLVINQQLHAFICPEFINNEYLAYWLETQKSYMESVASKTTILYMNKTNCESVPVVYPPLPEQQKIAQILSTWDKAIEKLEALIAAKQKRKKALMQQLLTGKVRFAGFDDEWRKIQLGDLGNCIRGVNYKPEQILSCEETGSIRLLRSTNIQNGILNDKELVIIPSALVKKNQLLEIGDLVLCMANGSKALVGKSAPFRNQKNVYTIGAFCAAFRPVKNANKEFIKFLFESETYSRELKILLSGSSINNLKGSEVESIKMFLPQDIKEQQKIAAVLSAADAEIETQQKYLAALKKQKQGLMQQLLTGKKRVKVDNHV